MNFQTAVVILNYNGKEFLQKFLPSVVKFSATAKIYVVDNFSSDLSIPFLEASYPQIQLIKLSQNYGFAGGYNEALKQIDSEYCILLNSDVEVTKNWLNPLEILAQSDNQIAAIQPKILDFNRKEYFEYAGAAGGFLDIFGYPFCKGRIFETLEKDTGQFEEEYPIFWASGACLFLKSSVFHSIGGFDASFFAHMEEIDLCWRFQNEGFKVMYCPKSSVFHVGGGTLNKSNPFKTFLNYRNNLSMLFKNLPSKFLIPILFSRLILDGVSALKFLKEGSFKDIFAILKAHFSFYSLIPKLITKRSKQFLGFQNLYKKSIIWDYFIRNKKEFKKL